MRPFRLLFCRIRVLISFENRKDKCLHRNPDSCFCKESVADFFFLNHNFQTDDEYLEKKKKGKKNTQKNASGQQKLVSCQLSRNMNYQKEKL